MIRFLLALLLSFLQGFAVTALLWPSRPRRRAETVFCASLGFGVGSAMSSWWFFIWLCLRGTTGAFTTTYILPELAFTAVLGLAYSAQCVKATPATTVDHPRASVDSNLLSRLLPVAFFVVLACAAALFVSIAIRNPDGDYDAISTWNLRARFLGQGAVDWKTAFLDSKGHSRASLDYPLLLPATIARFWRYAGNESVLVPVVIALLFTASSAALVWSSLNLARDRQTAYLGATILLSVLAFTELGAWQYADVVIGVFILAAACFLSFSMNQTNDSCERYSVLTGVAAGCCAWTKNEGILFAILVLTGQVALSILFTDRGRFPRRAAATILGMLPALAILIYFKISIAPMSSWLPGGHYAPGHPIYHFLDPAPVSQKVANLARYSSIAAAMAKEVLHLGGRTVGVIAVLALYLILVPPRRESVRQVGPSMALLLLMLMGHFFVYLVTPLNLEYHMKTSLSRLLLQLWPSVVFVCLMATSTSSPQNFPASSQPKKT